MFDWSSSPLTQIWKLVKSPEVIAREGKGLSRHRFAQVLRLIALAQSGSFPFTQENATAALHRHTWLALHGVPLPPPRLAAAGGSEGTEGVAQQQQEAAAVAADSSSGEAQQRAAPAPAAQQEDAAGPAPAGAAAAGSVDALFGDGLLGSAAAAGPAAADEDDDLFGLRMLQRRHGMPAGNAAGGAAAAAHQEGGAGTAEDAGEGLFRRLSRSQAVSHRDSRKGGLVRIAVGESLCLTAVMCFWGYGNAAWVHPSVAIVLSLLWRLPSHHLPRTCTAGGTNLAPLHQCPPAGELEAPVAFVARLPPLQPKVSAKLTMLAAGNGSLFAGPAVNGGLLQWGRPEGNMRRPLDVEGDGPQRQQVRRRRSWAGRVDGRAAELGNACSWCCFAA